MLTIYVNHARTNAHQHTPAHTNTHQHTQTHTNTHQHTQTKKQGEHFIKVVCDTTEITEHNRVDNRILLGDAKPKLRRREQHFYV